MIFIDKSHIKVNCKFCSPNKEETLTIDQLKERAQIKKGMCNVHQLTEADYFSYESKKWLCDQCKNTSQVESKKEKVDPESSLFPKDIEYSKNCENEQCNDREMEIKGFCTRCNKLLCKDCFNYHLHHVPLELSNENCTKYIEDIQANIKEIKEEVKIYEELSKKDNDIKKKFNIFKENFEAIQIYFDILFYTYYQIGNKAKDFNSALNLIKTKILSPNYEVIYGIALGYNKQQPQEKKKINIKNITNIITTITEAKPKLSEIINKTWTYWEEKGEDYNFSEEVLFRLSNLSIPYNYFDISPQYFAIDNQIRISNTDLVEPGVDILYYSQNYERIFVALRSGNISIYDLDLKLEDNLNDLISSYSHGMKQKLALISAFIREPKLLILDEPFSGLDPINIELFKDLIMDLKKKGTSIIFSSHRMDHVEYFCDSLAILVKGKTVLQGNLREIKEEYRKKNIIIEGEVDADKLKSVKGVINVEENKGVYTVNIEDKEINKDVFKVVSKSKNIVRYTLEDATLNEIFISKVGESYEK